ncbi:MAG: OmpA family protein [Candidatus Koribacter versatilis]|uniref:OmpA family protein n=1 Tax=Candidatus Korobacter versatilis TaxID=658062 RepID=A0A932A707_9BACT|nr:OmpA family protein [Candidatus Koribacter versatilis]
MKQVITVAAIAASTLLATGCATKNYVRKESAPIVNKVNELDDLTAKNTRDIRDVDSRATTGIQGAQAKADAADQKALAAGKTADDANVLATQAATRVDSLHNTVANLDNYKPVVETSVHFGFDKADLTSKAKEALDQLAAEIPNQKHFIVVVEGGTDSVGDANYNYQLSERRASAVIQYLAERYQVPAHKIYLIGLGKDKKVASNGSASGRAKNRRVDVRLMTNSTDAPQSASSSEPQS